jgi:calcium-dependent protein kinase
MGGKNGKEEDLEPSAMTMAILERKRQSMLSGNPLETGAELDFHMDKRAEPTHEDLFKLYKFGKTLGEGHSSVVKKCTLLKDSNQAFAVKIVSKTDGSAKELKYWTNELNILRHVEHPGIVRYYESYQDSKTYYHILEYCSGGTLSQYFYEKKRIGDLGLVKNLFYQAVSSIYYLHCHGICHRDIKLANFLIKDKKASRPQIKLIDFGFSKEYRKKRMRTLLGTTHYMSPEVIIDKDYGPECDNWSLGIMLYIMLFGEAPFEGETKIEMVKQMKSSQFKFNADFEAKNPHLIKIITGLLEFNPENRMDLKTVLLSPWFDSYYHYNFQSSIDFLTKERLMTLLVFEQKHRFQKILRNLFVKLFIDDPEIQALTGLFRMVDFNEDGEVSTGELLYFMRTVVDENICLKEMEEVFTNINMDQSQSLTYLGFVSACASQSFFSNAESRKVVFERIDYLGEGFITDKKLKTCLDRLGFSCDLEEITLGLKSYDMYKDGKITFFIFNTMFDKLDASEPEKMDKYENIYGKLNDFYSKFG